jgi:ribosomal protein S18 acetylase RimI-like enzyme
MADLMFAEPSVETVALAGSVDRAQRLGQGSLALAFDDHDNQVFVAEDEQIAGFAIVSAGRDTPSMRRLASMAVRAVGLVGAVSAAWRARARAAVDMQAPKGGLHLAELQVDPARRGQGIGGVLLDTVEEFARSEQAPHLSLTTTSANPARHLYERHGFELVDERSSDRYTRLTGVPGRVLMIKYLG